MDIRSIPFPPDFPVISTPGNFTGWTVSIEKNGVLSNVVISRKDTPQEIAIALRLLADMVEGKT